MFGIRDKAEGSTVEFVSRKDVFILLLTGYGKSVYYATILLIFDQLRGNIGSVVVVVSPLIALIKDQVESFKSKGLEAAFLVLDVGFVCCHLYECFNNEIHHYDWIPVVQADVKAVSRPFPALGLGLACETNSRPCAYSMPSVSKFSIAIIGVVLSDPQTLVIQHPGFSDEIISDDHTLEKQHPGSRDTLEKQILAINEEYQQGIYYICSIIKLCIYLFLNYIIFIHVIDELTLKGYKRRVSALKLQLLELEYEEGKYITCI